MTSDALRRDLETLLASLRQPGVDTATMADTVATWVEGKLAQARRETAIAVLRDCAELPGGEQVRARLRELEEGH